MLINYNLKAFLICAKSKRNKAMTSLFSTSSSSSNNNNHNNSSNSNYYKMRRNKSYQLFSKGLPFVIFIIAGSYFLSIFMTTHMELKDKNNQSKSSRKFDLEGIIMI